MSYKERKEFNVTIEVQHEDNQSDIHDDEDEQYQRQENIYSREYTYERTSLDKNSYVFLAKKLTYQDFEFEGTYQVNRSGQYSGLSRQNGNWLCPTDIKSKKKMGNRRRDKGYDTLSITERTEYLRNLRIACLKGDIDVTDFAFSVLGKEGVKLDVFEDSLEYDNADIQLKKNIDSILWTGFFQFYFC